MMIPLGPRHEYTSYIMIAWGVALFWPALGPLSSGSQTIASGLNPQGSSNSLASYQKAVVAMGFSEVQRAIPTMT
jgi:hypothetical protein